MGEKGQVQVSCINLHLLKKSALCCLWEWVEMQTSEVAGCCGCTRTAVVSRAQFTLTLNLGEVASES